MSTGRPFGKERHVLLGHDAGNDTLVAVTSGHLVADRDLSLLGQIHLDELDDARRQLVGLENAIDALLGLLLELRLLVVRRVDDLTHALVDALVLDAERLEVDATTASSRAATPRSAWCRPESPLRPCRT